MRNLYGSRLRALRSSLVKDLHSSLEFEITLKSISTYKLYTIFFLMTSALIWVHLLNDWKGRFEGLTPTGLAPPPIFGRKIVQFLHSQYLGQSQQKEKNYCTLMSKLKRELSVLLYAHWMKRCNSSLGTYNIWHQAAISLNLM